MKYFLAAIKNYAVFKGRSSRKEFWMFAVFGFVIFPLAQVVGFLIFPVETSLIGELFLYGYSLFILIPTLAIMTRRVHDTGQQGALVFLALIPYIGFLIILILCLQKGNTGLNRYGPESSDTNYFEPNQSENQSSYSETAESVQKSHAKQQNMVPQEPSKNKGYGCAFASLGSLLGGLSGGIIGYNIGESIMSVIYGIFGIAIGAILGGIVLGAIFGSKKK